MEGNTGKSMEENHAIVVSAETLRASQTLRRYSLGYRFTPLDQELIHGYLLRKIKGLSLPTNLMHEVDIYLHNPEYLAVNYEPQGDKIWYFLTPRVKRYKKGSRPNRSAEDGYWKATRVEKTIKTNDDQEIGFKKTLVYYRGNNASDGVKTNWIMHEFRINGPSLLGPSLKWKRDMLLDYVLCRIQQKKQKTEPVELDEEGNNSSAEEEGNNSNDDTNANANADADTKIDIDLKR
ncbi:hypothetical protein BVRB_6g136620 [Beta vulgaris subsp. vulgaris]|nr:hypothetical protein BVRB_6g136620 [Beta vulgaris subsp. vulgaris]